MAGERRKGGGYETDRATTAHTVKGIMTRAAELPTCADWKDETRERSGIAIDHHQVDEVGRRSFAQ